MPRHPPRDVRSSYRSDRHSWVAPTVSDSILKPRGERRQERDWSVPGRDHQGAHHVHALDGIGSPAGIVVGRRARTVLGPPSTMSERP